MAAPAVSRLRRAAGRINGHFGAALTFTKWAEQDRDVRKGSAGGWAPTSTVVTARASTFFEMVGREGREGETRRRVERIHVEIVPGFDAAGGLDDDWRVTLEDGTVRKISTPVLSDDGTYYEGELARG